MIKKQVKIKEGENKKYFEGVGRRKTAIARVRLYEGSGQISVNQKDFKEYFVSEHLRRTALASLETLKLKEKFSISARVGGGGLAAQAEALRLGLARALVLYDGELKKRLRSFGFLTRDSRMVERKKYGLKKARRAPQWQKR